jgi:CO/xanthine dehydrogenase FAD-binding subunit
MLLHVREYHRPHELPEALALLARPGIQTAPLAGGTTLVGEGSPEVEALVDLQDLGLDHWYQDPAGLYLGAMVRLETLVQAVGSYLPPMARAIGQAARNPMSDGTGIGEELWLLADTARELASPNLRNQATLGGVLASAPGNWLLLGALVALDAVVEAYNPSSSVVPQVPIQDHPARPALPNSQSLADPRTGAISNLQSLISNPSSTGSNNDDFHAS